MTGTTAARSSRVAEGGRERKSSMLAQGSRQRAPAPLCACVGTRRSTHRSCAGGAPLQWRVMSSGSQASGSHVPKVPRYARDDTLARGARFVPSQNCHPERSEGPSLFAGKRDAPLEWRALSDDHGHARFSSRDTRRSASASAVLASLRPSMALWNSGQNASLTRLSLPSRQLPHILSVYSTWVFST